MISESYSCSATRVRRSKSCEIAVGLLATVLGDARLPGRGFVGQTYECIWGRAGAFTLAAYVTASWFLLALVGPGADKMRFANGLSRGSPQQVNLGAPGNY
ncbi:hypothetical protein BKA62DRAFT_671414 [Auriculariales sp. MPI-PUGE-AT-0066]|nr:hypothetical protein BKA62DRAFT_671414 [Auriculariales sp. MPI-PUGE-AT-0066]